MNNLFGWKLKHLAIAFSFIGLVLGGVAIVIGFGADGPFLARLFIIFIGLSLFIDNVKFFLEWSNEDDEQE